MSDATRDVKVTYTADASGYIAETKRMAAATKDASQDIARATDAQGKAAERAARQAARAAAIEERAAGKAAREAKRAAAERAAALDKVSNAAVLAGGALALVVAASAKKWGDFDEAMSGARAATQATATEMLSLRTAAIQAGAGTKYSATEAAQAITELGKAGIATSDILGGGLTGSLALASAGQLEVGRAAEVAATALTQFELKGSDIAHVADLYSAAAGKAQGSTEDIAQAMKYAGVTANSMGIGIEETTGTLALFASKGIIGEQAGTSFRSMLMSLTAPSKIAAEEMERLGLSMYDGQGHFIGVSGAAQVLHDKLAPLSEAERNAALGRIFGNEAMGAAITLYEGGAKAVDEWTAKVDDTGFATRQAAMLTDNWRGDLERLRGALDTALISGADGSSGALRGLTKALTAVIDGWNDLPAPVQHSAVQLVALASAVLLVSGGVGKMIGVVSAAKAHLLALGVSGDVATASMSRLGAALGVVAAAIVAVELHDYIKASTVATVETDRLAAGLMRYATAGADAVDVTGGLADLFRDSNGIFPDEEIVTSAEALERFQRSASAADRASHGFLKDLVSGAGWGYSKAPFEKSIRQIDDALAEMVRSGHADAAAEALRKLTSGLSPTQMDLVQKNLTGYQTALNATATAAVQADPALAGLSSSQKAAATSAESAMKATKAYADAVRDLNSPTLSARQATRDFEAALDAAAEAAKEATKKGLSHKQMLNDGTEAGRSNAEALDAVASAALAQIGALQANGASQATLQSTLAVSRQRLIDTARQFGMSKSAAEAYADSVLAVPKSTNTKANFDGAAAESAVERLRVKLDGLNGKTVATYINVINRQTGSGMGTGIGGGLTRAEGGYVSASEHFASGGYRDSGAWVGRQSHFASGGSSITWNEPQTHGELFLSLMPSARARNQSLVEQFAPKLGMRAVRTDQPPAGLRSAGPAAMGGFDARSVAGLAGMVTAAVRSEFAAALTISLGSEPVFRGARSWASGRRR